MSADRILIEGLRLRVRIGVPAHERATPQELRADIEIVPATEFGGLADEIGRTVDYHAVVTAVEVLAGERERRLLETLADEIAACVLEFQGVAEAAVTLRKFILPQVDAVGVSVRRGGRGR